MGLVQRYVFYFKTQKMLETRKAMIRDLVYKKDYLPIASLKELSELQDIRERKNSFSANQPIGLNYSKRKISNAGENILPLDISHSKDIKNRKESIFTSLPGTQKNVKRMSTIGDKVTSLADLDFDMHMNGEGNKGQRFTKMLMESNKDQRFQTPKPEDRAMHRTSIQNVQRPSSRIDLNYAKNQINETPGSFEPRKSVANRGSSMATGQQLDSR